MISQKLEQEAKKVLTHINSKKEKMIHALEKDAKLDNLIEHIT